MSEDPRGEDSSWCSKFIGSVQCASSDILIDMQDYQYRFNLYDQSFDLSSNYSLDLSCCFIEVHFTILYANLEYQFNSFIIHFTRMKALYYLLSFHTSSQSL